MKYENDNKEAVRVYLGILVDVEVVLLFVC
jgi:hypothetical protein